MPQSFDESVALITGATSGIGLAAAHAFAEKGCKLVLSGRRKELGEDAVTEIRDKGGDAIFVQTDVDDEQQLKALVAQAVERFGRLDIAFNNAGIEGDPAIPIHETALENFDRVFRTNVRGVFVSMQEEIAAMLRTGGGAIVNNASIAGLIGFPGASAYGASKHAVIGMTKTVALEYANQGVRVNAVAPAVIGTGMFERFVDQNADVIDYAKTLHPIGRFGRSEEVAQAVVWLAAPENSFTTGITVPVDGGFTAQ